MTRRIFKKYLALLVIYTVITKLIGYYGLRVYYTFAENPKVLPVTVQSFQLIVTAFELFLSLVIVILMMVDQKAKKLPEWLIILLTLLRADIGIPIFLVWVFYKDWMQKNDAKL